MKGRLFFLLLCSPLILYSEEILNEELTVDLKNPLFEEGLLKTSEGGVIAGKNLRVQAQNITYKSTIDDGIAKRVVEASGDLFVVFKDKPFVAEGLRYDFVSGKGVLYNARTYVDFWYLGGKQIILHPDGSFEAEEAFITTSSNKNSSWELRSSSMLVNKKRTLSAANLSLRFFKIPIFWMPAFKASFRHLKDPLVKYKLTWDKGLGPRATVRYQFVSSEHLDLFLRADYRLKYGLGGAVESIYKDPKEKTQFLTRSYYAYDKTVDIEKSPHRYRFQGLFKKVDEDERSIFYLSYDKLSDQDMISDFKSDDFVINTEKRSYLFIGRQESDALFRFSLQPRLNTFQSLNEELPKVLLNLRSQDLGHSGLIANSDSAVAYLHYKYANGLHPYFLPYHAYRMQTLNQLYRPFSLKGFTVTPKVGVLGIFYNNGPFHHDVSQLSYNYGLSTQLRIAAYSPSFSHVLEPYLDYEGFSKPWVNNDSHYYFYLDDGVSKLNVIRSGLRQNIQTSGYLSSVTADLYVLSFCKGMNYPQAIAKYGANLELFFRSFYLKGYVLYNVGAQHLDYVNIATAITFTEEFALGLEYRNRGRFAWRKSDYDNYFLDVARPDSELVQSPISDKRQTVLGKLKLRLSPRVATEIGGHYGFGRSTEPSYKGTNVDLIFNIGGSWNLKLGYQHSPDTDRFTTNFYISP